MLTLDRFKKPHELNILSELFYIKKGSYNRNNNYWNSSNLTPKDPVVFNFCSEVDIKKAIEKADRRIAREKKKSEKVNQNI